MKLDKPWGRAPYEKPLRFYRANDGKIVPPLPAMKAMAQEDLPKVVVLATPDWMALGDYVVYSTKDGEYAAMVERDGIPHLWTTKGVDCRGNNAKVMVGPDFDWSSTTPGGWIERAKNTVLRDAERMFPELQWAIEWDAPELNASGRECSENLKKGN